MRPGMATAAEAYGDLRSRTSRRKVHCGIRTRGPGVVQEEQTMWKPIGVRQVWEVEAMCRECMARAAVGWLCLLHNLVRGKGLLVSHADRHLRMMAEGRLQGVNAFIVRGIHHLLWMESQHRSCMTA